MINNRTLLYTHKTNKTFWTENIKTRTYSRVLGMVHADCQRPEWCRDEHIYHSKHRCDILKSQGVLDVECSSAYTGHATIDNMRQQKTIHRDNLRNSVTSEPKIKIRRLRHFIDLKNNGHLWLGQIIKSGMETETKWK